MGIPCMYHVPSYLKLRQTILTNKEYNKNTKHINTSRGTDHCIDLLD